MKSNIKKLCVAGSIALAGINFAGCSLDEFNPGGFTMENTATSKEGFQQLVNQCYFALERAFYGCDGWVQLNEGGTDLWTSAANQNTSNTQYFWYYAGASPNTTYTNAIWNAGYDGIGSCNVVIANAHRPPLSETERNELVAQARFLRAIYYFNLVEHFGSVTMITEPAKDVNFEPTRTAPLEIYEKVILPDLEFAAQWLNKGTDALNTIPTKKSALAFLAKAYLSTVQYDASKSYVSKALETAKKLIADAENGGTDYLAHLYSSYEEVFDERNNWENKEAMWKHRWYVGSDGHGSSNGNYRTNRNVEYFYCKYDNFGARQDVQASRITWGGNQPGIFMPTQHLLNLYVQPDATLDPRFHKTFQTSWSANKAYTWNAGDVSKFDRDPSVVGKTLAVNDKAIRFLMPQDPDYTTEANNKHKANYLVIDYNDLYDDTKKSVKMKYPYTNPSGQYKPDGTSENLFRYFYPSLTKFNSGRYHVVNAGNQRNGNLNSIFMMRMAEVYLIAAEADIYANGSSAMTYINKIRSRAGATQLGGAATLRTVLDERARELCGEDTRFFDLKRTGMLKDKTYLQQTHPDLAQYFKPEYALRPISTSFTSILNGGGAYYQNPGY